MSDNPIKDKRLYRSSTDKQLAGVCGGLAEYFGIDTTIVRLGWIVITVFTGVFPGLVGYLVAAVVIPASPATEPPAEKPSKDKESKES